MKKCPFCSIVECNEPHHEIIWQNKNHIAFLDAFSMHDGHVQVIPKKHIDYLFDLEKREYSAFLEAAREVAIILKKVFKCKRIGVAVEGFSVPHAHIHLVPLNSGAPIETNHENRGRRSADELFVIGEKIRKNI